MREEQDRSVPCEVQNIDPRRAKIGSLGVWRHHVSEDIHHECGIAALYWLGRPYGRGGKASASVHRQDVVPLLAPLAVDALSGLRAADLQDVPGREAVPVSGRSRRRSEGRNRHPDE